MDLVSSPLTKVVVTMEHTAKASPPSLLPSSNCVMSTCIGQAQDSGGVFSASHRQELRGCDHH